MSMTELELDIYRKYRQQLRAQNKRNRGGTHAAERRQNARVAIVSQFGIPFAEVKRIVALGDAANGITHESNDGSSVDYDETAEALRVERIPLTQVRLGDRIMYATGTDARIIAIEGLTFTFFGKHHNHWQTERWSITLEADMTLPVVVNRPRRLPGAVLADERQYS
jgi:hypothetical protein